MSEKQPSKPPPFVLPKRLAAYADAFERASHRYQVGKFIIAAICDRESGGGTFLVPRGPTGTGDKGFGHGLMQIDSRYHKKFIESGKWADAGENILYGAKLLRENLDYFKGDEFPAIASYNCSRAKVANFVNMCWPDITARNILIDRLTTGQNYASDVLERADKFRAATLLAQKKLPTT